MCSLFSQNFSHIRFEHSFGQRLILMLSKTQYLANMVALMTLKKLLHTFDAQIRG